MTPLDRLDWLAAVAHADVLPCARSVAMFAALVARDGRLMHGTDKIAEAAALSENGAANGIDALEAAGFLLLVEKSGQHRPCVYMLVRPPQACGAENHQTPTRVGVSDPHRHVGLKLLRPPQKRAQTPTGVGPHGGEHEEEGERDGELPKSESDPGVVTEPSPTPTDITVDDYLVALRRMRAHFRLKDQDITQEWLGLGDDHGRRQVLAVIRDTPAKDRWPSTVDRAMTAAADMPGLNERQVTAEEARALLLGDQTKDAHAAG